MRENVLPMGDLTTDERKRITNELFKQVGKENVISMGNFN